MSKRPERIRGKPTGRKKSPRKKIDPKPVRRSGAGAASSAPDLPAAERTPKPPASASSRLHAGLIDLSNALMSIQSLSGTVARERAALAQAKHIKFSTQSKEELAEVLETLSKQEVREAVAPELIGAARDSLVDARAACGALREAVRDGGAQPLDTATSPGNQTRSVEMLARIKGCERLLTNLDAGLSTPNAVLDRDVEEAGTLLAWCRSVTLDLEGALELGKIPPPPNGAGGLYDPLDFSVRGCTAKRLQEIANIKKSTFADIRQAAGLHGRHPHVQNRHYDATEIRMLAKAAASVHMINGKRKVFRNGEKIAQKWLECAEKYEAPASE